MNQTLRRAAAAFLLATLPVLAVVPTAAGAALADDGSAAAPLPDDLTGPVLDFANPDQPAMPEVAGQQASAQDDEYLARLAAYPDLGVRVSAGTVGLHALLRPDSQFGNGGAGEVAGVMAGLTSGDPDYVARLAGFPTAGLRIGVGTVSLRALSRPDTVYGPGGETSQGG